MVGVDEKQVRAPVGGTSRKACGSSLPSSSHIIKRGCVDMVDATDLPPTVKSTVTGSLSCVSESTGEGIVKQ